MFCASSTQSLWFIKPIFEMSSSNFFVKRSHNANNDQSYLHFIQIPECPNFTWQIYTCSYFLDSSTADVAVIWDSDLIQIGCFVDFIHHNYVEFIVDDLMVSLDREISRDFCYFQLLVLVGVGTMVCISR